MYKTMSAVNGPLNEAKLKITLIPDISILLIIPSSALIYDAGFKFSKRKSSAQSIIPYCKNVPA